MSATLFRFVQFEFPWELGPPEGRYVLRGHAGVPAHVLVVKTLGAPERRSLMARRRKAQPAEPQPEPTPVTTTRATLVGAESFASAAEADAWQRAADRDAEVDEALAVLNDVLYAHRVATADPHVREVSREQALVVRVGIGEGEQVADGRWTEAVEVTATRSHRRERRTAALQPQERLAAILGGRDVALACEDLALRARLDLDAGRGREAALQLRVALEAAIAELAPWRDRPGMAERIGRLQEERGAVGAAANAALQGGLDDETGEAVSHALQRVEAALRARTALGHD